MRRRQQGSPGFVLKAFKMQKFDLSLQRKKDNSDIVFYQYLSVATRSSLSQEQKTGHLNKNFLSSVLTLNVIRGVNGLCQTNKMCFPDAS